MKKFKYPFGPWVYFFLGVGVFVIGYIICRTNATGLQGYTWGIFAMTWVDKLWCCIAPSAKERMKKGA